MAVVQGGWNSQRVTIGESETGGDHNPPIRRKTEMNSTSKTPNTDALIERLTVEDAKVYAAQTDKLIWIETTLLDPADIPRKMAIRVEDALLAILSQNEAVFHFLFPVTSVSMAEAPGQSVRHT